MPRPPISSPAYLLCALFLVETSGCTPTKAPAQPPAATLAAPRPVPPAGASRTPPVDARPPAPAPEPELEPAPAPVRHPFHEALPAQNLPANAPAMRYANLAPWACRNEIKKRALPFKRDGRPTPGVATAVRFTGPIDGVTFVAASWKSPYGVFDCRLALTFADMVPTLKEHGVERVLFGTVYRRGSKLRRGKPSQHAHALAADVIGFTLENGVTLNVEQDYAGQIGEPSCGPESRLFEPNDQSVPLRNLTCALARGGFFHYILTPNHDQAHHDHLHVDIKRGAKRSVIR